MSVLDKDWSLSPSTFEEVFEADKKARLFALEELG